MPFHTNQSNIQSINILVFVSVGCHLGMESLVHELLGIPANQYYVLDIVSQGVLLVVNLGLSGHVKRKRLVGEEIQSWLEKWEPKDVA